MRLEDEYFEWIDGFKEEIKEKIDKNPEQTTSILLYGLLEQARMINVNISELVERKNE